MSTWRKAKIRVKSTKHRSCRAGSQSFPMCSLLIYPAVSVCVGIAVLSCFAKALAANDEAADGADKRSIEWMTQNAPFDVARYFATIPSSENAASLYLDALYEFEPLEMERCMSPIEIES